MTIYAIGDIHGQLELLMLAHMRIAVDQARHQTDGSPIVHIGDFVDRGPDVKGTIDYLISRHEGGMNDVYLLGNHDRMMLAFLQPSAQPDPLREDLFWLDANIGGRATLASYDVDVSWMRRTGRIHKEARARVPEAHLRFLENLLPFYAAPGLFFCHAGIRPGIALSRQKVDDLVWIRGEFLSDRRDHGVLVVHGHTPVPRIEHHRNRVAIDTGAAYGGPLSVVAIEDGKVYEVTDEGRIAVPSEVDESPAA